MNECRINEQAEAQPVKDEKYYKEQLEISERRVNQLTGEVNGMKMAYELLLKRINSKPSAYNIANTIDDVKDRMARS